MITMFADAIPIFVVILFAICWIGYSVYFLINRKRQQIRYRLDIEKTALYPTRRETVDQKGKAVTLSKDELSEVPTFKITDASKDIGIMRITVTVLYPRSTKTATFDLTYNFDSGKSNWIKDSGWKWKMVYIEKDDDYYHFQLVLFH